jgi:uncharacterized protein (TIGR00369 family)
MEFFTDGFSVVSWVTVPENLCGWDNLAHGGVISTILDEIMSWSAIRLLKRLILTKSMSVDFLKPVPIGMELTAVGRVRERVNDREAIVEGEIFNDSGEICARASGAVALFTMEFIKEKNLASQEQIDFFTSVFLDA